MLNYNRIIVFIYFLFCQVLFSQNRLDSLNFYIENGKIEKAIKYGEKLKQVSNKNDFDYAILLNKLAPLYDDQGKYKEAEDLYLQIPKTIKKIKGEDNIDYARSINNLAAFYYQQESYDKAETLFLESIIIIKKVLGEMHPNYALALDNMCALYTSLGEYKKAETMCLEALEISKKVLGENDPQYISSQIKIAGLYFQQGKYSEAKSIYLNVLEISKKVLGENHPDYAIHLTSLAVICRYLGEYEKAESLCFQTLEIYKKTLGENNIKNNHPISTLALIYKDKGEYQKAEPLYLQSLEILKKASQENTHTYAIILNNLASLYSELGNDQKAEAFYLQSKEIRKNIFGENHPEFASSLNNLASLYSRQGNYEKAEALYLQSKEIRKKAFGENHPDYASSLNSLAIFYENQGEFQKAESFYLQSLEIRKKSLGENHLDYAESLNDLADFYVNQGNFKKAKLLILQSLEVRKNILGENHIDYAESLDNLALLFSRQGNYEKAELLLLQSTEIKKKVLGENHQSYAESLNYLARSYNSQGCYQEAEVLFLQSLAIIKKELGENHPNYATCLNDLAGNYKDKGDFKKAEFLYLESLAIIKKVFKDNSKELIFLNNLAGLYFDQGNFEKASVYFQSSILCFQDQIKQANVYQSEKELEFFRKDKLLDLYFPLSFLHDQPNQYSKINIGCYDNELLIKNRSLRNQQFLAKNIQKSSDTVLQIKYKQYISNKIKLTKMNELSIEKRPKYYEQLTIETESIEKELVKQSIVFSEFKSNLEINWRQVQEKLKPNNITIDLITFHYYDKKWTESIIYAAFVVCKNYKYPKYIPLFEQKQLEILLAGNDEKNKTDNIAKLYSNKSISDLFLKPLEKELEGITNIYLSPSGLGHQIDFSALPISDTQTLGEKYQVHILGSTAELVNYKVVGLDKKSNLDLLLYGDIDYEKSDTVNKIYSETNENNGNSEFAALATRSGISKWKNLEGTKKEVEQINNNSKQNGFVSTIINGRLATEESIKKLDGRTTPYVLHLATHGFFFPDPIQETPKDNKSFEGKSKIYKASDDPMMRSGLILAGANNYWVKSNQNNTIEDGILTASEISNLDLSACQLAVLSACETGLGEVKGSEGVFGLQRAFKMAGVKNIIMSLWKVPDAETAELFDIFYSECFAGKSIHEAFQSAQSQMKAKYSPYYWAGFVLLE